MRTGVQQYIQNRIFEYDQKKLYKELDGDSSGTDKICMPDAEESCEFWSSIWDNPIEHNRDAEWLNDVKDELSQCLAQEDVKISEVDMRRQLKKVANWKGPGPDGVQGCWLKSFTTLHGRVVLQLNEVLESDSVPQWMARGRTILCPKDPTTANAVENFRPITCLSLMWKLFSGVLSEKIYDHLEAEQLFPEEQKGCRTGSRGTKEHLFLDEMVMRIVRGGRQT